MKLALTLSAVLLLSGISAHPALAMPEFYNTFRQTYSVAPGSPLGKSRCLTCHAAAGPPARNPYGKTVEAALNAGAAKSVTSSLLHQVEGANSDGDGFTNGQEIRAGTLPGDPKSHPDTPPAIGTHASGKTMPGMSEHMATPGAKQSSGSGLFPLHSFHPQIVHFPIALFLFGEMLEILGLWKRRPAWREAGFLCMAGASVTSLAAVATGLTALYRNEYAIKGNVLIHLILALSATTAMAVTALAGRAAVKKGKDRSGWFWNWIALLIALLLVSVAGYWGGILVYG